MSDRFETRFDLVAAVLAFLAYEHTDYFQYADGAAHRDYLEEQIALAARNYVASVEMDDNKPVGW